jgi:predicted membrane GTPase involved in stress response
VVKQTRQHLKSGVIAGDQKKNFFFFFFFFFFFQRVLSMADGVLLLVDASEGPMPQTRFVTSKAFEQGLRPIVVINKMDKLTARPDEVLDEVFQLFESLGATDAQLDFPVVFASASNGWASLQAVKTGSNMDALLDTILKHVPPPKARSRKLVLYTLLKNLFHIRLM